MLNRTILPARISGCSAVWQRACFGSRMSEVQILSPRFFLFFPQQFVKKILTERKTVGPATILSRLFMPRLYSLITVNSAPVSKVKAYDQIKKKEGYDDN